MNEEQMKHVANLISQDIEKDKEIEKLNNIIDKLENCFEKNYFDFNDDRYREMKEIFELKEDK